MLKIYCILHAIANDVLHSNFSKITLLAAFDLLLFLLLVSLPDVVKKSLVSDYCLTDRLKRNANV